MCLASMVRPGGGGGGGGGGGPSPTQPDELLGMGGGLAGGIMGGPGMMGGGLGLGMMGGDFGGAMMDDYSSFGSIGSLSGDPLGNMASAHDPFVDMSNIMPDVSLAHTDMAATLLPPPADLLPPVKPKGKGGRKPKPKPEVTPPHQPLPTAASSRLTRLSRSRLSLTRRRTLRHSSTARAPVAAAPAADLPHTWPPSRAPSARCHPKSWRRWPRSSPPWVARLARVAVAWTPSCGRWARTVNPGFTHTHTPCPRVMTWTRRCCRQSSRAFGCGERARRQRRAPADERQAQASGRSWDSIPPRPPRTRPRARAPLPPPPPPMPS